MKQRILLALWAFIILFACEEKDEKEPEPDGIENPKEIKTEVFLGKGAVYYGSVNNETMATLIKFQFVVIEPGFISSTNAPSNAIPYVSLTGVNQNNASLSKLSQDIHNVNGFLKKNGNFVEDPNGEGTFMVDLTNSQAFNTLKAFIIAQANAYKGGVFLDAIDSATSIENNNPQFAGLIDAAVKLITEVSGEVHKTPSKKVIINGGLIARTSNIEKDIIKSVVSAADFITTEAQYYNEKFTVRPLSDNNWTRTRLTAAAEAAVQNNKTLTILALEPSPSGQQTVAANAAANFFKTLMKEISTATGCDTETYIYTSNGYTNPTDLTANLNLAEK